MKVYTCLVTILLLQAVPTNAYGLNDEQDLANVCACLCCKKTYSLTARELKGGRIVPWFFDQVVQSSSIRVGRGPFEEQQQELEEEYEYEEWERHAGTDSDSESDLSSGSSASGYPNTSISSSSSDSGPVDDTTSICAPIENMTFKVNDCASCISKNCQKYFGKQCALKRRSVIAYCTVKTAWYVLFVPYAFAVSTLALLVLSFFKR